MVTEMKKKMNDRAISDVELIKLDGNEDTADEGEDKVRDDSSFEAGSQNGWQYPYRKGKQSKDYVYKGRESTKF